jgi:hypothetical protein
MRGILLITTHTISRQRNQLRPSPNWASALSARKPAPHHNRSVKACELLKKL